MFGHCGTLVCIVVGRRRVVGCTGDSGRESRRSSATDLAAFMFPLGFGHATAALPDKRQRPRNFTALVKRPSGVHRMHKIRRDAVPRRHQSYCKLDLLAVTVGKCHRGTGCNRQQNLGWSTGRDHTSAATKCTNDKRREIN